MKVVIVSTFAILGISALCYGVYQILHDANLFSGGASIFIAILLGIGSLMSAINNTANIIVRFFSKNDSTPKLSGNTNNSTNQSGGIYVAKIDTLNVNAPFANSATNGEEKNMERTKDYLIAKKSLQYIDSKTLKNFSEYFESQFPMVDQNTIRPIENFITEFDCLELKYECELLEELKISAISSMKKFIIEIKENMSTANVKPYYLQINVKNDRRWRSDYREVYEKECKSICDAKDAMMLTWSRYLEKVNEKFPKIFFYNG